MKDMVVQRERYVGPSVRHGNAIADGFENLIDHK